MIDIEFIKNNPDEFDGIMSSRGDKNRSSAILGLYKLRCKLVSDIQFNRQRKNSLSDKIKSLKSNGSSAQEEIKQSIELDKKISEQQKALNDDKFYDVLASVPNILNPTVPRGSCDEDNLVIKSVGNPRSFDFEIKSHDKIGFDLGLMDFVDTAKVSGSRYCTLSGDLALMERALSCMMLDININEFGYKEFSPPLLVLENSMYNSCQLPKFANDAFTTSCGMWAIPTSEVSLVNMISDKVLTNLPVRMTACTPCFRKEAGSAGRDTKGIIRQHQFNKVEIVSATLPSESDSELWRMTEIASKILTILGLPHRIVLLCSADVGFASSMTYDIEVWIPSQNQYREISSCSNCLDFQSRRLRSKYVNKTTKKKSFVHTLNGSALAIGRTIVAIMENYQNSDGTINIPEALVSYMGGVKKIS